MRKSQKLEPRGRVSNADVGAISVPVTTRGRGAISNAVGRFEREERLAFDDGWASEEHDAGQIETTLLSEAAKTIITFNRSPDIPFDRSINPFRGCEHGCIYCFARPSHAYSGMSAGLDFESKLFFKRNATELLRRELGKPSYVPRTIALGVNTDAYQPIERQLRLTRSILVILHAHNHPVSLLSKSALITRDIDLLSDMATRNLVRVGISITTLDPKLARKMEPRASSSLKRFEAVRALSDAGVPTVVMTAPIIPCINDVEIEQLIEAAADHGAIGAGYVLLRLPHEVKDLFHEWLAEHYPDRAARVINTLREMRGGSDYDAQWFERGVGKGSVARLIAMRFARALRTHGLDSRRTPLRTDLFRPPSRDERQFVMDI